MNDDFLIAKIDEELFNKIKGKSYKDNCTVSVDDLRYLKVLHKNLNGETLHGELICNVRIADSLIAIFKKLYEENYPIEKIQLIDDYNADDELSMRDNNSSCFNFRLVSNTNRISLHGYGMAVDINPRYNPYITFDNEHKKIEPSNGVDYEDRQKDFSYKIVEGDLCYELFTQYGFTWGGNCWDDALDYQHFFIEEGIVR